jgi:hypothetical protein
MPYKLNTKDQISYRLQHSLPMTPDSDIPQLEKKPVADWSRNTSYTYLVVEGNVSEHSFISSELERHLDRQGKN